MTALKPLQSDEEWAFSDSDVCRLIRVFKASGSRSLDLRHLSTRLKLKAPSFVEYETATEAERTTKQVKSTGVGTFHAIREWAPGTSVTAETLLGHVRSVSRERELRAECNGVIAAQLVPDCTFLAYGDPVFEIRVCPA